MKRRIFAILLGLLMLSSCGQNTTDVDDSEESVDVLGDGDEITVTGEFEESGGEYFITVEGEGLKLAKNYSGSDYDVEYSVAADISCILYENHEGEKVTVKGILNKDNGEYTLTECDPDCDCCITYKIVEPTEEEIEEAFDRLKPVLGDQACNIGESGSGIDDIGGYHYFLDNDVYNYFFDYVTWSFFDISFPDYGEEIKKYLTEDELQSRIKAQDPLGHFGVYPKPLDEMGLNLDLSTMEESDLRSQFFREHPEYDIYRGYVKFPGEAIDWLIGEVWNLEISHDMVMESWHGDGILLYYHEGDYILKWQYSQGQGGMPQPRVESFIDITPTRNNRYQISYVVNYMGSYQQRTATIAMKESSNGFRFWSIYDIDVINYDDDLGETPYDPGY